MAHFLALLDPDRDRARRVGDAARNALGSEAGLRTGALECGDLEVIWAAHRDAPVDVHEERGGGAVVWGILQTCYYLEIPLSGRINCGRCEKCVRAMPVLAVGPACRAEGRR